eukprot:GDKI01009383.1.p2 GENE.GDKI01009383.1~~GDKI01009383.1.p2  ORF type:complete len:184 (+),score=74.10 GDKI01009383.1:44-553(+)
MSDSENQHQDDPTFESADAGASHTYPCQAGNIKKNGFCMLKGHPCKVVDIATSKTGKHGHAKAAITGIDIFTGKKYEDGCPTSHNLDVPFVKKIEYQVMDISADNFLSLLAENNDMKDDLSLPDDTDDDKELASRLKKEFEAGKGLIVTVQMACGIEKVIAMKEMSGSA